MIWSNSPTLLADLLLYNLFIFCSWTSKLKHLPLRQFLAVCLPEMLLKVGVLAGMSVKQPTEKHLAIAKAALDPGSWIQDPDLGSWIQGPGARILDAGSWILEPGSWILGSRILDPGSWIQDPGSKILDTGSWIQDPGSRIPDPGTCIQDPGSTILDHGSWILILDPGSRILDPGSWIRILYPGSWIQSGLEGLRRPPLCSVLLAL